MDTGLQRELVGFVANSKVRDGEAWRCLDSTGIPAIAWYRMPLWIKLKMEPPIIYSRLDLEKDREGCRFRDVLSKPIYGNM